MSSMTLVALPVVVSTRICSCGGVSIALPPHVAIHLGGESHANNVHFGEGVGSVKLDQKPEGVGRAGPGASALQNKSPTALGLLRLDPRSCPAVLRAVQPREHRRVLQFGNPNQVNP